MSFRTEVRSWLDENCPASCRGPGEVPGGGTKVPMTDDQRLWLDRCAERGFSVPTWPEEYGGAGLEKDEYVVLLEEMRSLGVRAPVAGMGTSMIGPTLLEYGTDDQKARHLPRIARGEVWWCQGYSEPGSGSDLASLRTRAEDHGDHFVINGQKIWTSGAFNADWIFCLTRTDPDVPKHDGISFLLFTMHQPGVTVRPIRLISGASPLLRDLLRQCHREQGGSRRRSEPRLDGGEAPPAARTLWHFDARERRQPRDRRGTR